MKLYAGDQRVSFLLASTNLIHHCYDYKLNIATLFDWNMEIMIVNDIDCGFSSTLHYVIMELFGCVVKGGGM